MRCHVLTVLALGLLLGAAPRPEASPLDGNWTVTELISNGKKVEEAAGMKIKIADGKFQTFRGDQQASAGTAKVDASKTPIAIDTTYTEGPNKGKGRKGLVEVKGDTARICFSDVDGDRPTEFASKEGTKVLLFTLKKDQ
jgi:uncharacterized protein (TIGR03067 family)